MMEKNRLQEIKETFVFLTIVVFVTGVLIAAVLHEPWNALFSGWSNVFGIDGNIVYLPPY